MKEIKFEKQLSNGTVVQLYKSPGENPTLPGDKTDDWTLVAVSSQGVTIPLWTYHYSVFFKNVAGWTNQDMFSISDAISKDGWISVLYSTSSLVGIDTFRINSDNKVVVHSTQFGDRHSWTEIVRLTFQITPKNLGVIYQHKEIDNNLHTDRWILSIKNDRPVWEKVESNVSPTK